LYVKRIEISVFGRPFVKWFALCYRTVVCLVCPVMSVCLSVCDVGVLWPNGWMDQDETWHGGRPPFRPYCIRWSRRRPRRHCVRWGPNSPAPKRGIAPTFRLMSIVAKRLGESRCHFVRR